MKNYTILTIFISIVCISLCILNDYNWLDTIIVSSIITVIVMVVKYFTDKIFDRFS